MASAEHIRNALEELSALTRIAALSELVDNLRSQIVAVPSSATGGLPVALPALNVGGN